MPDIPTGHSFKHRNSKVVISKVHKKFTDKLFSDPHLTMPLLGWLSLSHDSGDQAGRDKLDMDDLSKSAAGFNASHHGDIHVLARVILPE